MIFATVGTQLPFPRLMAALDALAAGLDEAIVAQVGPDPRAYDNLQTYPSLPPDAFGRQIDSARLIVGHAGIGTVLTAQARGKPLVVLPRRHALGEHRNDHQMATAQQIARLEGVHIAWEADALADILTRSDLQPVQREAGADRAALIARVAAFIRE